MARRIVLFGATGYTGRRIAERLAASGERPLLAGRDEERLEALADRLGGLPWRHADALRRNSVFSLVDDEDVVVSTVAPFVRWGEPAVRAAIAAGATYLDSTGEPAFIRRVFEELGPAARRAGAPLLTAMGYDYVAGAVAGALALEAAGPDAVRVDVGYFAFGLGPGSASPGTRLSLVGASLDPQFAWRDGRLRSARAAERVRSFEVRGRERPAISIGGAEHFTLPAAYARLREVNVYLGWTGPLARPLQVGTLATSLATRVPGVRRVLQSTGERLAGALGTDDPDDSRGGSFVTATAHAADGRELARASLEGDNGYRFTAGFMAWAARRAARQGVDGTGALGPVEAFGLDALREGVEAGGLTVVD